MSVRFVNVDRETPMMLPPSLQDWVDDDDMVHFVIDAVDSMDLPELKVNHRGSGHAQYPPRMMLALLIYCYAHGIMSSRKIERATWQLVAVRYLSGDTHPDHDTINAFRKDNAKAIQDAFGQLLRMAKRVGLLKLGTVSIDGTHIKANASKHKNVRYDRITELEQQLDADIAALLAEAEAADEQDDDSGYRLPREIARREVLRARLQEAKAEIEQQAREKEGRRQDREDHDDDAGPNLPMGPKPGVRQKKRIDPQEARPQDRQQINLIDPDSALMRKSRRDGWQQAYNAQAVVDAEGTQLILGAYVAESPTDHYELEPALQTIDRELGTPQVVLADAGYARARLIERFEADRQAPELFLAISAEDHDMRRYDYRPQTAKPTKTIRNRHLLAMREKVRSTEGKKIYGKRKQTVEPVFGIIKSVIGLEQFLRRGFTAVNSEWNLVCTAYNMKRLWRLCTGGSHRIALTGG